MAWGPPKTRAQRRAKLKGGVSAVKFNKWDSGMKGRYLSRHGEAPKGGMVVPGGGGTRTDVTRASAKPGSATKIQYDGWSKELQAAYKRRHGKAPTK